jgi:cytidine deaminase
MQTIHFHPRYLEPVRSGRKTRTTRFRDPAGLGNAVLSFAQSRGSALLLPAVVTGIVDTQFDLLTDDDARHEDLATAQDLKDVLRWHYPTIASSDAVQVVTFHLR